MNAYITAHSAYSRPQTPARSQRSLEYEILARVTQKLRNDWQHRKQDFPAYVQALHDNLLLWSTLAIDVAQEGNELPPPLRARLFYLYEFTQQHTAKLIEGHGSAEVLVDINTAVMRGLRGVAGDRE